MSQALDTGCEAGSCERVTEHADSVWACAVCAHARGEPSRGVVATKDPGSIGAGTYPEHPGGEPGSAGGLPKHSGGEPGRGDVVREHRREVRALAVDADTGGGVGSDSSHTRSCPGVKADDAVLE